MRIFEACALREAGFFSTITVRIIFDYIWCQTCEDSADRPGGVPGVGVIIGDGEAQPCVWLEPGEGGMTILDFK